MRRTVLDAQLREAPSRQHVQHIVPRGHLRVGQNALAGVDQNLLVLAGRRPRQHHLLDVAVGGAEEGERVRPGVGGRHRRDRFVVEVEEGVRDDRRDAGDLQADAAEVEDVADGLRGGERWDGETKRGSWSNE